MYAIRSYYDVVTPPETVARRFTTALERNWRLTSYSALTVQHGSTSVSVPTPQPETTPAVMSESIPAIESIESVNEQAISQTEPVVPPAPVYDVFHFPSYNFV